jgi:CheY-like chemotaxis protein
MADSSLGPHILIVDDEAEIREVLVVAAGQIKNARVSVASNGIEALEILKNSDVQAIITDLAMPHMNGFEFLRRLKVSGKSIPTMVLTGHGDKNVVQQLRNYGVNEFLSKPWDNQVFLITLQKMIQQGQKKAS